MGVESCGRIYQHDEDLKWKFSLSMSMPCGEHMHVPFFLFFLLLLFYFFFYMLNSFSDSTKNKNI